MTKAVRARRIQAVAESAPPAIINLAFRTMFSASSTSWYLRAPTSWYRTYGAALPALLRGRRVQASTRSAPS